MDLLTRRRFLLASGMAGLAAAGGAAGMVTWKDLQQRAIASPLPVGSKILVLLTLYGGNDGLNTVIPYADGAYHDARPGLAYTAAEVHQLGDGLGLNPALTGMYGLWQRKQLAILRGVDYPNPDFSHFRSMDIWQTGSPDAPVTTGWIGRWLDAGGDDPIRAVNIGSVLPPLSVGKRCTAAALPLGRQRPLAPDLATAFAGLSRPDGSDTEADALVAASYAAELKVSATFESVLSGAASSTAQGPPAADGSADESNPLSRQLDLVAKCVSAGVPTTVYCVDLGGFDTHADEKATQQAQLATLDSALSSFLTSMAGSPRGRGVTVMAYSEFGRRVALNASGGTDHGSAGPVFVAGAGVRGGFYGEEPSLTDLNDGNLKPSLDFRSVYAEILAKTLGTDPARILGTTPPPIGFLT